MRRPRVLQRPVRRNRDPEMRAQIGQPPAWKLCKILPRKLQRIHALSLIHISRQKERLRRLLEERGIAPEFDVELLTRNEASRMADRILAGDRD